MATVNIGGDKKDKSYRYKMPLLKTKIEGRGNGIKTVIPNMLDIAKALQIDPAYPTKYFGLELGAQSKFDKKRQEAIVNGAHDAAHLSKLLDKFIELFVLCPNCGLPEIKMDIRKSVVKIKCAACGHHSDLNPAHKLVTFILKNPTDGKKETEGKKKDRKKLNREASNGSKDDEEGSDVVNDENEAEEDENNSPSDAGDKPKAKVEAAELPAPSEVQFLTDTSEEAAKQRRQQELAEIKAAKAATNASPDELAATAVSSSDAPIDVMRATLARHSSDVALITSELRRLQLARGLDDVQKAALLLESIIDPENPKGIPNQFKQNSKLLRNFAKDTKNQLLLLDGFEQLVGVTYPKLMAGTARFLQTLYEADILPEEVILQWHEFPVEVSKLTNKQVASDIRRKATKLVEWLKNAEEESGDE